MTARGMPLKWQGRASSRTQAHTRTRLPCTPTPKRLHMTSQPASKSATGTARCTVRSHNKQGYTKCELKTRRQLENCRSPHTSTNHPSARQASHAHLCFSSHQCWRETERSRWPGPCASRTPVESCSNARTSVGRHTGCSRSSPTWHGVLNSVSAASLHMNTHEHLREILAHETE